MDKAIEIVMSETYRVIRCRPGQSVMDAAHEHGLSIHPDSPTPGRSSDSLTTWAADHGVDLAAIVQVRFGETFAAIRDRAR